MSTGGRSRGAARQLAAVVRDGGARASTSGRAGPDERSPVHHLLGKIWAFGARRRRSGPGSGGTAAAPPPAADPAKRADERLARHLGLPAIPLPKSLVDGHRGVDPRWRIHRVSTETTATSTGQPRVTLIVQDARRAEITREREYFGVDAPGPNAANTDAADREPHLWKWLANAGMNISTKSPSRQGVWVLADRIQPPPNNGGRSAGGASLFDDVRGRRTVRANRASPLFTARATRGGGAGLIPGAKIEFTPEGEAVVDHVALNALLYLQKPNTREVYVSFLGLHAGRVGQAAGGQGQAGHQSVHSGRGKSAADHVAMGEQLAFHAEAARRINWLGTRLGFDVNSDRWDGRSPVTMCEPWRLQLTRLPPKVAEAGGGKDRWLIACVVPPANAAFDGGGVAGGTANNALADNPVVVADLVESIDFAQRTGTRLAVCGLELAGTHPQRLISKSTGTPPSSSFDWSSSAGEEIDSIDSISPADAQWRLQREDLVNAVDKAARAHAAVTTAYVRENTQRIWLEDWTHEGLRLEEASALVVDGARSPEWAVRWFAGFSRPYLTTPNDRALVSALSKWGADAGRGGKADSFSADVTSSSSSSSSSSGAAVSSRSPPWFFLDPMASLARFWKGSLSRLFPNLYMSGNVTHADYVRGAVTPLMRETCRYLANEIGEKRCVELLAEQNVAGARECLHDFLLGSKFDGGSVLDRDWNAMFPPGSSAASEGLGNTRDGYFPPGSSAPSAPSAPSSSSSSSSRGARFFDAIMGDNLPLRAASDENLREPGLLFAAFRKFRNNVDLMTTRVGAWHLNLAFGHVLARVEHLRTTSPDDVSLLPLHRMTVDWIERLCEGHRSYLVDGRGIRQVYLRDADKVSRGATALIDRCDDLRRRMDDLRARHEGALADLKTLAEDVEKGFAKGDADAMAMAMGAEVERTYDLSDESGLNHDTLLEDDFTSAGWRESLRRLEEAIARLESFEPDFTEDARVAASSSPDGFVRAMSYDLPPYVPSAEDDFGSNDELTETSDDFGSEDGRAEREAVLAGAVGKLEPSKAEFTTKNSGPVRATTSAPVTIDLDGTVSALRLRGPATDGDSTHHRPRAGPGADFPLVDEAEMLSVYEDWLRPLNEAHCVLLRAYELRKQMRAAVDLVAATEKIDPSGIRTAIEKAKTEGAPHSTVVAAEERLLALEDELAAFIRARRRRGNDSLLPPPKQGWTGAGRHVWYNEKDELGRGSLGTAVYAGVYDEQEGRNTVVRRPAAIKRIPLPPGERRDAVRALVEREVGLHRFLNQNSKRVTFLYGVHLDGDDAVFTAMERCGESLSQWLSNAPDGEVANLNPKERVDAAAAIVAAVADVHAANVVHNDVKPDNCLRASSGEFKLADLGLGVRMKDADVAGKSSGRYSMTTFAGYGVNVQMTGRPPEVLQGDALTTAVDVWSLGSLVYTTLTGHPSPYAESTAGSKGPVGGSTGADTIAGLYENQRIIKGAFNLNALETAKLPRHVVVAARHCVHDMLQPDPKDRPTAAAVRDHPLFWTTERCVEAVRDVYDARILNDLSPEEEAAIVAEAWGAGRKESVGRRTARSLQGWKDQIVPELRRRLVTRQRALQETGGAGVTSVTTGDGSSSDASAPDVSRVNGTRGAARGGAHQSKKTVKENGGVSGANDGSSSDDGTGYESSIRDLFRLVRNLHEHPPLDINRGDRTKRAMVKSMGALASTVPARGDEDPWSQARRVVEGYLTHAFPELPIIAKYLLDNREHIERLKSRRGEIPIVGDGGSAGGRGQGQQRQQGSQQQKGGSQQQKQRGRKQRGKK